jgi:hypothetical protein
MSEERRADDLPELPDPEPRVPEPAELEELPVEAHAVSPAAPVPPGSAVATGVGAPGRAGARPPLRKLDRVPAHLRTAALLVLAGAALPFLGPGPGWASATAAKACALAAAGLWYAQVLHDFGPPLTGVLGALASTVVPLPAKLRKKAPRGRGAAPAALEHPFPTALHLLAFGLIAFGVWLAVQDDRRGPIQAAIGSKGLSEAAMFGWAAFTFVHIAAYERWRRFNPLFPLLFLGMLFAGLASLVTALDTEGPSKLAGLAGGAAVAIGGGLAAYTIVEAMLQAKKEGDRKKADALEARKAARKASREAKP